MSENGIRSYRDLIVWRKGMDLVELAYAVTRQFPKTEVFGLGNQMNR
jgi:four helix bundle protein